MKRKASLLAGISSIFLCISLAYSNPHIVSVDQGFITECGMYPVSACAAPYWSGRAGAYYGIAATMAAELNNPLFQAWCQANPGLCDDYYMELNYVTAAWQYCVTKYNQWV